MSFFSSKILICYHPRSRMWFCYFRHREKTRLIFAQFRLLEDHTGLRSYMHFCFELYRRGIYIDIAFDSEKLLLPVELLHKKNSIRRSKDSTVNGYNRFLMSKEDYELLFLTWFPNTDN